LTPSCFLPPLLSDCRVRLRAGGLQQCHAITKLADVLAGGLEQVSTPVFLCGCGAAQCRARDVCQLGVPQQLRGASVIQRGRQASTYGVPCKPVGAEG
jgi:hypothetical protein